MYRALTSSLMPVAFAATALSFSVAVSESSSSSSSSSSSPSRKKLKVGVLGATGTVGQRFLERLEGHPWFEVTGLGASSRSAGKPLKTAAKWHLGADMPEEAKDKVVRTCKPDEFSDCDFVFSALDASVAGDVETAFAEAGIPVFSNARNHRMATNVPLVVPPVNGDHLDVVQYQPWYKKGGFIVTNANCSSTGLCIALKPIQDAFGITEAMVVTLQAISGAGYPGVSTLDSMDNVVPVIGGEEDKLEKEFRKILGDARKSGPSFFDELDFPLSAHSTRVPVRDGHLICLSLKLAKKASPEDVAAVLATYSPALKNVSTLPSAPDVWIRVRDEPDRPQPIKDRNEGAGYTTVIGRVRECPVYDVKMVVLSHNTVMGAAGSSILNAELAVTRGLLRQRAGVP